MQLHRAQLLLPASREQPDLALHRERQCLPRQRAYRNQRVHGKPALSVSRRRPVQLHGRRVGLFHRWLSRDQAHAERELWLRVWAVQVRRRTRLSLRVCCGRLVL